jgi:2-keto-4-pentenoate hydratase/2-oxohepta-3-ene-1,7-dioic acid hydratase in catechol pathway
LRIWRYRPVEADGPARVAVQAAAGAPLVDLASAWDGAAPDGTLALIEAGPEAWERARRIAEEAPGAALVDDVVRWLCPFDRLASLRDFLAFESHVLLGARRRGGDVPSYWYEAPVYYKGNHRELLGPDDEIPWPEYTEHLDFELELAMIVGSKGSDIDPADAADHIFGFTLFNDLSARDVQMREVSAWLGPAKGKDFGNVFGPCIVTADEVGASPDLEMRCFVNGEEWGRGRSGDLHWSWGDMLAHVSRGETVYPGDVYGSGTPGGCCGLDLGRRLSPGDEVRLELGLPADLVLENKVRSRR